MTVKISKDIVEGLLNVIYCMHHIFTPYLRLASLTTLKNWKT